MEEKVVRKKENLYFAELDVPGEKVRKLADEKLKKSGMNVVVRGFRRGKVPLRVLKKIFNYEDFLKEATVEIWQEFLSRLEKKLGKERITDPKVSITYLSDKDVYAISGEVEFFPELNMELPREVEVVLEPFDREGSVERALYRLRFREADFEESEEVFSPCRVTVAREKKEYVVEVHDVSLAEEKELENLLGKKKGDEVELWSKTWTVSKIEQANLPELDDEEFLGKLGFSSSEELRKAIEDLVKEEREKYVLEAKRDALMDSIVEINSDVDLPPTLEELEFRRLLSDLELDLRVRGMTLDQFLEESGLDSLSALREEWADAIRKNVIVGIYLDRYAEKEGIEVYPEEVEERVRELAGNLGTDPKKLKEAMLRDGSYYTVKVTLLREKALDRLMAGVDFKERTKGEQKEEE